MELFILLLSGVLIFIVIAVFFRTMRISDNEPGKPGSEADKYTSARAAESLSQMIRFQTVSAEPAASIGVFNKLTEYLRMRYPNVFETFRTEEIEGHLLFRWRGTDEDADPVLFCANCDVASADGTWEYGPFDGEIAEDMVWGRGAIDGKGVLCALLEAAEIAAAEGFRPQRDLYLLVFRDEETGGGGAEEIKEILRKRGVRFSAVFAKGACISRDLVPIRRPQAVVGVADKGHLKVRLTAEDKGGRSGFPPRYTAIGRLCEAVCRIEYRPQSIRKSVVMRDMIAGFAPYLPFGLRVMAANLWLFEGRFIKSMRGYSAFQSMLRTTVSTTSIQAGSGENKLPGIAAADVHIRTIYGDSCSDICQHLVNLVGSLGVRVEADVAVEASEISPYRGKEYAKLKTALTECFGDMAIVPAVIADNTRTNPFGPISDAVYRITPFVLTEAEKATIHSTNERIGKEALGLAVVFYRKLFDSVAG